MKKTIESRLEALEREVFKKEEWGKGDTVFWIDSVGNVRTGIFEGIHIWTKNKNFLGLFHTKAEAEARLEAVKNFIKTL